MTLALGLCDVAGRQQGGVQFLKFPKSIFLNCYCVSSLYVLMVKWPCRVLCSHSSTWVCQQWRWPSSLAGWRQTPAGVCQHLDTAAGCQSPRAPVWSPLVDTKSVPGKATRAHGVRLSVNTVLQLVVYTSCSTPTVGWKPEAYLLSKNRLFRYI